MSKGKVYGLRIAIGLLVFIFFKITSANRFEWDLPTLVSMVYTVSTVLILLEIIGYTGKYLIKNYKDSLTSSSTLAKFFIGNCLLTAPIVIGASVIHTEILLPLFPCVNCDTETSLITTIAQGLVLSWLIISAKSFIIYVEFTKRSEHEKAIMQKELALSKYEGLKDQIEPHFLFNSFSVLTAVIEENPKLAVDFVSRLSKIYRYLLENTSQLVFLKTELEYLEHYVFVLKTRHGQSIHVNYNIETGTTQIPILSLQMLVENALKHNYFSKEKPLTIDIFTEGNDFLVVSNSLNKRSNLEKTTHLGLENINKRYELLLNKSIVIQESADSFTVKLPLVSPLKSES
ncbi:sensor histidine kinase [Roseivirga echinicomitans]